MASIFALQLQAPPCIPKFTYPTAFFSETWIHLRVVRSGSLISVADPGFPRGGANCRNLLFCKIVADNCMMVLVTRKTDGSQDEICLEQKRGKREIRGFVLTYFLISRLISSWNPSVFCQQALSMKDSSQSRPELKLCQPGTRLCNARDVLFTI